MNKKKNLFRRHQNASPSTLVHYYKHADIPLLFCGSWLQVHSLTCYVSAIAVQLMSNDGNINTPAVHTHKPAQ